MNKKCFFFRFYILCENFSKIGPIIKKNRKFQSDPLNVTSKGVYFPFRTYTKFLLLRIYLPITTKVKFVTAVKFHYRLTECSVNSSFSENVTPLGSNIYSAGDCTSIQFCTNFYKS